MSRYLCVVDLETAAPWTDAVIYSLGITFSEYKVGQDNFDRLVSTGLYVKFDALDQVKRLKRTVEKATLEWWAKQSPEAKQFSTIKSDLDVCIDSLPNIFNEYFKNKPVTFKSCDVWDRRSFDFSKLEHLYKVNFDTQSLSWNYMNEYEVSTFLRFQGFDRYGGIKLEDIPGAIYHNPLHDAAVDHIRILRSLESNGLLSNE